MSPSDWAAWVGTAGTLAAVWSAFWIYKRSRADAQADAATRRRVLLAMLKEHVFLTIVDVGENIQKLHRFINSTQTGPWSEDVIPLLQIRNQDRMFELQSELLDSAQEQDIAIAQFIEACRAYETQRRKLESATRMLKCSDELIAAKTQAHFMSVLLAEAHEVNRLADAAVASFE